MIKTQKTGNRRELKHYEGINKKKKKKYIDNIMFKS